MVIALSGGVLSSLVLLLGGFVAGFYGASVGSGSLVSFPALLLVGIPTHIAIATNRFAVFFGELTGAVQYYRGGNRIDGRLALLMGVIASIGTVLGTQIVLFLSVQTLNIIIATLLLSLMIVLVLFPSLGVVTRAQSRRSKALLAFIAFPIGIYSGFFGAGNGTFLAMAMVFSGLSFIQSAATARTIGIMTALTAWASFASTGTIDYVHGLPLGIGYSLGCLIGVRMAIKKGNRYIRFLLMGIILVSVAKLLFDAVRM